jgi:hypothetical protein
VSSLELLGEAGWLPDVRSEESLPGQACNQPSRQPGRRTVRILPFWRSGRIFFFAQPISLWVVASPEPSMMIAKSSTVSDMSPRLRPENVPDSIMSIGRRMNANAGGVARAAGGDGGSPGGEQDIGSAASVDARDMVIVRDCHDSCKSGRIGTLHGNGHTRSRLCGRGKRQEKESRARDGRRCGRAGSQNNTTLTFDAADGAA